MLVRELAEILKLKAVGCDVVNWKLKWQVEYFDLERGRWGLWVILKGLPPKKKQKLQVSSAHNKVILLVSFAWVPRNNHNRKFINHHLFILNQPNAKTPLLMYNVYVIIYWFYYLSVIIRLTKLINLFLA